jgi:hypothetical protein
VRTTRRLPALATVPAKPPSSRSEAARAAVGRAGRTPTDPRERNGTGEEADEQQLGVDEEEVKDLANDAEGG